MRHLATILGVAICLLRASLALAGGIPVDESALAAGGMAYEVNRDGAGNVYVTDWGQGEVWRVAPETGAYTRYGGLGNPNDARPDASGAIWLTDYWKPVLIRINTGANPATKTTWDLSGWDPGRTYTLAGLAFDGSGKLWFSEWGEISATQLLYRFDPATNQLCGYTLPGGDHSYYVLYQAPYLWLGDWVQGSIVQFNPANLAINTWAIGSQAQPRGLAVDAGGNLWWADIGAGKLGRLAPASNTLTTYSLPDAGQPNNGAPRMLAVRDGKVWYAARGDEVGTIGVLDPALAVGSVSTARLRTAVAAGTCKPSLGAGVTAPITVAAGSLNWRSATWTDVTPAGRAGWSVYQAPGAEQPYGIAADAAHFWIADPGTNVLMRWMPPTPPPTPGNTATPTKTATPPPTNTPASTPTGTVVALNTGLKPPSANAPVSTGSGDNNGFETNPRSAYASDNAYAVDADSGTSASSSYTDPGKDRHLFYNFGLGLPAGATVLGVEVQLEARADSSASSPSMYVQLSGDGGATWTAAKATAALKKTETVVTLGAPNDLWGRTWAAAQLADGVFRARISNVATDTRRDFYLDRIAVRVTYR